MDHRTHTHPNLACRPNLPTLSHPPVTISYMANGETTMNLGERFWSKVNVSSTEDCWEWTGARLPDGYGAFRFEGEPHYTHRLVMGLRNGDPGCALHHCDNPPCVNPAHLFIGTQADNNRDRAAKGRNGDTSGENSGVAKLTWPKVDEIRARYAAGGIFQRELGAEYGVSDTHISAIVNNLRWVRS
jgi:hypothetical protein